MGSNIEKAIEALRAGKILIISDDEDRENEGDAVMAAQFATPERINFMISHCKGLVCTPISPKIAKRLHLSPLTDDLSVRKTHFSLTTNFTMSVDHISCTTGISAVERATTIRALANPHSNPQDFVRPGHIFPLLSDENGLKKRRGHTEATINLLEKAGLEPVGVICEIINPDGSMARQKDLVTFGKKHELPLLTIAEIIHI